MALDALWWAIPKERRVRSASAGPESRILGNEAFTVHRTFGKKITSASSGHVLVTVRRGQ